MQQFGLGQAELVADRSPERVRVGNIGSSGQDGVALQSLVTCRLSLQPFGGALVVHSDFSALGSTTTRVVVVSGGTVVGEYRVANGDVAHLP